MRLQVGSFSARTKESHGALAVLRESVAQGVTTIYTSGFLGPHVTNRISREALQPISSDDLPSSNKISERRGV